VPDAEIIPISPHIVSERERGERGEHLLTMSPSFVDLGKLQNLACGLAWGRKLPWDDFARALRLEVCKSIRGVDEVLVSKAQMTVQIFTHDEWGKYTYTFHPKNDWFKESP
jgi:hypothetical protein